MPLLQLVGIQRVVRGIAFAEQQPVAPRAGCDACTQMRAQTGDAGAIADQQHRLVGCGWVEAGVAAQAQRDGCADRCMDAEPAATQPQAAVGVPMLAYQQFCMAFLGNGCERIVAMGQGGQAAHHCFCVHCGTVACSSSSACSRICIRTHTSVAFDSGFCFRFCIGAGTGTHIDTESGTGIDGKLRAAEPVAQGAAVDLLRAIVVVTPQPGLDRIRGMTRCDLRDIACAPLRQRAIAWRQAQSVNRRTRTAGIDVDTFA